MKEDEWRRRLDSFDVRRGGLPAFNLRRDVPSCLRILSSRRYYGPGGHQITDFFRVGVVLQLLLAIVTGLGVYVF